jgi:hypothetical protein
MKVCILCGGLLHYSIEKLKSTVFFLGGYLDQEIDNTLMFCKKHFSEQ